jgi:uncharacterized protein (DUF433 family)
MRLLSDLEAENTRQKLASLEEEYEAAKGRDMGSPAAKELALFSLRRMINQMKEELIRYECDIHKERPVTDEQLLERIDVHSTVMAGKPVIKGTRVPVEYIVRRLAHGTTEEVLLEEYRGLIEADIHACLLFAGQALEKAELSV